jgi:TM2 domain-containing membrane protein YozV
MTYDPQGQYPPPNQDPNAAGGYPAGGPGYPTSGAAPASGGAYPASGGPYPPQSGQPYQQGGYQASSYDPYQQQAGYPQQGYQQPGYQQPGYPPGAPGQMAVDPMTGQPLSDKNKMAAGLFSLLLGGFGVGRFYMGYTGLGIVQIVVTLFTCGAGHLWGMIEGIIILANNSIPDAQGRKLQDN